MFESDSRYAALPTAMIRLPDGRTVRYLRRRVVPRERAHRLIQALTPGAEERLDLFTARTLGDPEHYWRLCDANGVIDPFVALSARRPIKVPLPE